MRSKAGGIKESPHLNPSLMKLQCIQNKDEVLQGITGEVNHHKEMKNKMISETTDTRRHRKKYL